MKLFYSCIIVIFSASLVHAEDWTVDGRTYQDVKVTKTEADCVHVMYIGGIGSIPLADLPPDLQKRFNYVPATAKATAEQREADRLEAVKEMEASHPAPVTTPSPESTPAQVASVDAAPVVATKPSVDRVAVQNQIDQLNQAIAQQEAEVARNSWKEATRQSSSQNPYRDRIAEEHREIAELNAQLNSR